MITYSSLGRRSVRALRSNFETTLANTALGRTFRIIPAYRKNANLKQLLVRAKLRPPMQPRNGVQHFTTVRNPRTGHGFPIPHHLPRTQANCVYVVKCRRCGKPYVGEAGNALNTRLTQHRYIIRKSSGTSSHLAGHFRRHGEESMLVRPLEHDPTWTQEDRRKRETYWIRTLGTRYPQGLNDRRPCRRTT